ncbi:hypothetical protein AX14_010046 [Amanita brunnescens Koide BX004]|nr:hypothetical protein AX14_010046 [Amanita brunnescens Koide BX004]
MLSPQQAVFASVVRFSDPSGWSKVGLDEPLGQLHGKFWGTSMQDEEQEWRNGQPAIPQALVCGELGSEDQRVDVDWDDDEDIIPGCYVLNIGVDNLTFSKI